jgi:hypothetical protein
LFCRKQTFVVCFHPMQPNKIVRVLPKDHPDSVFGHVNLRIDP